MSHMKKWSNIHNHTRTNSRNSVKLECSLYGTPEKMLILALEIFPANKCACNN